MNKILTVYDDVDPLNNVISALTLGIDEIFYVYHHDVPKRNFENIKTVINRYCDAKTHFIRLTDDEKQMREIIENNKDLIIDVGGAKYLSLFLFEMTSVLDNKLIYYDDDENCIKDYRSHSVITDKVFKLQIEDVLTLRGGEIQSTMHKPVTDKETRETLLRVVEKNIDTYPAFTRFITKVNTIINSSKYLGFNTYKLTESDRNAIASDNTYKNIEDLFTIDDKDRLRFKNRKLREMVAVSGAFLENYLYIKLTESGLFDDVKMSTVIDFAEDNFRYPVRCEIDCLIIKDNRLLFVSCKSSKVDTEALNEIYVHNHRFGNVLSVPVLCVFEELDRKYPSTYAKGEELGIFLVDRSSFVENDVSEVFASILDGTYIYDEVY
ncbi:MAG: DUF1887 family protein [Erysipelotrichaceae bacterium]|nr:DUF1887 family protein [Erysipelotrichaceae bacterium]